MVTAAISVGNQCSEGQYFDNGPEMLVRRLKRNALFFIKRHRKELAFVLSFASIFAAIDLFYGFFLAHYWQNTILSVFTAKPASVIINLLNPQEQVILEKI